MRSRRSWPVPKAWPAPRSIVTPDGRAALIGMADGDGRTLLNLFEQVSPPGRRPARRRRRWAKRLTRRAPVYDKSGDGHYNLISALHKSVRGSDPDASLYWLARMLDAGEDPRYLARRVTRMAVEDIGLADPRGGETMPRRVGRPTSASARPEGELAIAQAVALPRPGAQVELRPMSHSNQATADGEARSGSKAPADAHSERADRDDESSRATARATTMTTTPRMRSPGQHYFPDGMERQRILPSDVERGFEQRTGRARSRYFRQNCARRAYRRMIEKLVLVAIGGAIGAVAAVSRRVRVGHGVSTWRDLPGARSSVNVIGSFLMGVACHRDPDAPVRRSRSAAVSTRVRDDRRASAAFTTFSAFSLDVFRLFDEGAKRRRGRAFYVAGSVTLSILVHWSFGIMLVARSGRAMTGVVHRTVSATTRRNSVSIAGSVGTGPICSQGRIEKMCRKGEIRVDGARVQARRPVWRPGQHGADSAAAADAYERRPRPLPRPIDPGGQPRSMRSIFRDDHMIVLNKPPGLAVQGGSKQVHATSAPCCRALRFGRVR